MNHVIRLCRIWIIGPCLVLLHGCGAGDGPKSLQSDSGKTTEQKPAPAADSPTAPVAPASALEAGRVIDLRTFPRLDGAKVEEMGLGRLRYSAPGEVAPTVKFYRQKLGETGWTELKSYGSEEWPHILFAKQGFQIRFTVTKDYHQKANVIVDVTNHGNFDARRLPRMANAEDSYGEHTFAGYFTVSPVKEAAAFTRQELKGLGWQEYRRLDGRRQETDTDVSLKFCHHAIGLHVSIGPAPAKGGKTSLQFHPRVLVDIPTPPDAEDVRIGEHSLFRLQCQTPAALDQVIDFYKKELPPLGWMLREGAGLVKSDEATLFFDAASKHQLMMELFFKEGKTTVKFVHLLPQDGKGSSKPGDK